jgi:hypothetical protein
VVGAGPDLPLPGGDTGDQHEMETAVKLQPENPEAEAYVRRYAKNIY